MRRTFLAWLGRGLAPAAMLLTSACDPTDPSAPDAGGLPDAIQCDDDSDCSDDGRFCNGRPSCEEEVFMTRSGPWLLRSCRANPPPCAARLCDEAADSCRCPEPDADGDGFDSIACGGLDCDDDDAARSPGRTEICDAADKDEDCSGLTFGDRDADEDGAVDASCCNGDRCGTDCNDTERSTHLGANETCDGLDNDCDTGIDEGVSVTSFPDADGDGWGTGEGETLCPGVAHHAVLDGDCDDALSQIHPGAFHCVDGANIEICGDDASWTADTCPGLGLCVPQPDGTGVCLPGDETAPECADGLDNDGDGESDFRDPQCTSPFDNTEAARLCADGLDDDDDGLVDFPNDPGCSSAEDNSEDNPATPAVCSNGLDDDNDGKTDYAGGAGDPGCVSSADASEREAGGPTCDNGADDDSDTAVDFPADKGCAGPTSAELPACSNGFDDDFDGTIDFGSDPGCDSASDDGERGPINSNYICDNGIDDDMDGVTDYPGDPGCTAPRDTTEG